MKYINMILVILFFLAWNENDFITHQAQYCFFPDWDWYTTNNWITNSWWLKNVFTFLLDGMHFTSSLYRVIGYFFFAQLIFIDVRIIKRTWLVYAITISLYIITGTIHSIMNNTL